MGVVKGNINHVVDLYGNTNRIYSSIVNYIIPFKIFEKSSTYGLKMVDETTYGYNFKFKCQLGVGNALVLNKKASRNYTKDIDDDGLVLFGIGTMPENKGIGKLFINELFDYFNVDKFYLPSSEHHPVWNKIATKEKKFENHTIFSITRDQLNRSL